jgi:hypothetical protein
MPARADQTLELVADSRTFRLVFRWQEDRWHHAISEIMAGGDEQLLIQSHEGTSSSIWPPSPALQDLSIEHRGDASVALAVGMSGKSNFSSAITSFRDAVGVGWEFDLACRAKELPDWIGSHYQAFAPIKLHLPAVHHHDQPATDPGLYLTPITPGATCEQASADFELWKIAPGPFAHTFPQTICWKYRLTFVCR